MDKIEFKITGTKTKIITEQEKRSIKDIKSERDDLLQRVRDHRIRIAKEEGKVEKIEERLKKIDDVIELVEPKKKNIKNVFP